jgi:hypothetical protein
VNGIFEVKFRVRFAGGVAIEAAICNVSPEVKDCEQTSVYE